LFATLIRRRGGVRKDGATILTGIISMTMVNGPWRPLQIQLRKTWSALTDDDLHTIARDSRELVNVVQQRCGDDRFSAAQALGLRLSGDEPVIEKTNRGDGHRRGETAYGPRVTNLIERILS
jgi:hypothetical protein